MPVQRFPVRRRDGFREVGPGFVEQGVGRGRRRRTQAAGDLARPRVGGGKQAPLFGQHGADDIGGTLGPGWLRGKGFGVNLGDPHLIGDQTERVPYRRFLAEGQRVDPQIALERIEGIQRRPVLPW